MKSSQVSCAEETTPGHPDALVVSFISTRIQLHSMMDLTFQTMEAAVAAEIVDVRVVQVAEGAVVVEAKYS